MKSLLAVLIAVLPLVAAAESAAHRELQIVLHATPNLTRGGELFETCSVCHGSLGGGVRDGSIPRIAGQHFTVLAKQLVDYRHARRWDIRMEHFADRHHLPNAQAIADVAGYVHDLHIDRPPGVGAGEELDRGQRVYTQHCMSCHGSRGEGDSRRAVPRVAGQHYEYLMRQIYDAVDGRRPNLPLAHTHLLSRLQRADIVGVADYLSRIDNDFRSPSPPATAEALRTVRADR